MGVYFISDGERVKIGYTAQSVDKRMAALQTANSKQLELLAFKSEWSLQKERELHRKFKRFKVTGEWFKLTEEIKAFIVDAKAMNDTLKPSENFTVDYSNTTPENVVACREWFNHLYKYGATPEGFLQHWAKDEYDSLAEKAANGRVYSDCGETIEVKDDKYPVLEQARYYQHTLVGAVAEAHGINTKARQYRYASSVELFKLYKRYFFPPYYNDKTWKQFVEQSNRNHDEYFTTQWQDTFYAYIGSITAWACMDGNQPVVDLREDVDNVAFFNALIHRPEQAKLAGRRTLGKYLTIDDTVQGFKVFCDYYGLQGKVTKDSMQLIPR